MSLETKDRGFAIRKDVSEKDGQHVQLDLDITSTHMAESIVTIEESVPPGTEHSQIGFLPDHEPVEWDLADDGTLLLSASLPPEGTRRIIYGLRDIEPSEADPLGEEPRVVEVGGPAAEQAGAGGEGAAAEDEAPSEAEAAASDEGASVETPLDEETAEAIAAAIEPHLDVGGDNDPVTQTKVSQLQEDVADMRAYLPAFEEFLGETGRADDILTELENIKSRIDDLEDGPDELLETVADLEARLGAIEERLGAIEAWRGAIAEASQAPEGVPAGDVAGGESDQAEGEEEADGEEGDVDEEEADGDGEDADEEEAPEGEEADEEGGDAEEESEAADEDDEDADADEDDS